MADLGLTKTLIRDKRYDAVIHMVTAADGAEQFYNTIIKHDNVYESAGDARAKDERLRHAYMGHKKWTMIKNTEVNTFQQKINIARHAALSILGKNTEIAQQKKKYLLKFENDLINRLRKN